MSGSLFCCPLCAAPLSRGERTYACPNGHSFDRAKEGYVHLLPANRMHSKSPGDDKGMAAARGRFLSGGYYAPLREALSAARGAPRLAGVDLSKPSVRQAARRAPGAEFAVASAYRLPLADGAADLLP